MQADLSPPAPAVVAVVVACDPGPWFAEVLSSIAGQDYPNLSVLVVDVASEVDLGPLVADVLPDAFVRRLDRRVGFGTAANEVLGGVEGASHFVLCHDDVALDPAAVRLLVEEAFRSNAGVASPKYVEWDDDSRLLAVGMTTDRVGVLRNPVEPGELDQEQHDAVRDILVAPSGATLVRADLFSALGGFDPAVDRDGEDVDLCWRACVAGARLTSVPAARVRHLQATAKGLRAAPEPGQRLRSNAHRYRTMLTCYRLSTLAMVLPVALLWAAGEVITFALQGRPAEGWPALRGFGSALRQPGLLRARLAVQRSRAVPDAELRRLQVRGNTRLRLFLQTQFEDIRKGLGSALQLGATQEDAGWDTGDGEGADWYGGPVAERVGGLSAPGPSGAGRLRGAALIWITLLFVLLLGSRSLIGSALPQIGSLPYQGGGWLALWRDWWSTWQPSGLGVGAPATPAFGLLAIAGTLLFGAVGTMEHVVVLGPLLLGPIGAWRAARSWGSGRGRLAAAVLYTVVPLPYDDLARGRWEGLVAYAAAPWVLGGLCRLSDTVPLPSLPARDVAARVVGLALACGLVASVAPAWIYVVFLVGAAMSLGSVVAGRPAASVRVLAAGAATGAGAFVLLLPWSATVVGSGAALAGPGPGPAGRLGWGQVLAFHVGPFGGHWQWLLLLAGALPLFIGREWRLEWAARAWAVVLVCLAAAWAGRRGWVPALPPELVLAPAAAALAMSAALGAAAFDIDLPGYRFGWRQVAAALAGGALAVSFVPFVAAAGGGRWDLPTSDARSALTTLSDARAGGYRILWVGAPAALPMASRSLGSGFAYATSVDGPPTISDTWATGAAGAAPVLADDLHLAQGRLTTQLGHLLAPAGVLYLVVPSHLGPAGSGAPAVPVPGRLLDSLPLQTDMRPFNSGDPNYTVYENAAWAPVRSILSPGAVASGALSPRTDPRVSEQANLKGDQPLGQASIRAGIAYFGSTRSGGWSLSTVHGSSRPVAAFGWAMAFRPPGGALLQRPQLRYSSPLLLRFGDVLQILFWVGALAFVVVAARWRRRVPGPETRPEWFTPMARPGRRTRLSEPATTPGPADDEVWSEA